jgi:hypothetical protein
MPTQDKRQKIAESAELTTGKSITWIDDMAFRATAENKLA